ncbi:MAG: indolepyruvate oxidoreductase subunit beta [Bacillota bacterium]
MVREKAPLNIIITGVGGQGNVLASQVVAMAAVESGLKVTVGETYGLSQRGGSVMSHVRISGNLRCGPLIPRGQAALILGFEPLEALRVLVEYGNSQTLVIMNNRPNYPLGVLAGEDEYPDLTLLKEEIRRLAGEVRILPATELAKQAGNVLATNMVMAGALAGSDVLPVPLPVFQTVMGNLFSGEILNINLKAFLLGVRAAGEGTS